MKKGMVAIVSVFFGVVFLAGCGQQPEPKEQAQTTTPNPVVQESEQPTPTEPTTMPDSEGQEPGQPALETQLTQGTVYKNTQYGFELTLPAGWENYKAETKSNAVEISLPTNDPEYKVEADSGTGKKYVPLVEVLFWTVDDWKKNMERCATEPDPSCYVENAATARSDKYVFIVDQSQAAPPADVDLIDADGNVKDFLTPIKRSFKISQ